MARTAQRYRDGRGCAAEPNFLGVGQALLEVVEDSSPVQVRDVDGVPGPPDPLCEVADTGRQSVRVVEQQHLSHFAFPFTVRTRLVPPER